MALLATSCSSGPTRGSYLDAPPPGASSGVGLELDPDATLLGESLFYVLQHRLDRASSSGPPIHLLNVEILGLPSFVVVDRVGAIKFPRAPVDKNESTRYTAPEASEGADKEKYYEPWQPVTDVTLTRLCLGGGNDFCAGWQLVAQVQMTKMQKWKSRGVRVTYEVEGKTYFQDYPDTVAAAPFGQTP